MFVYFIRGESILVHEEVIRSVDISTQIVIVRSDLVLLNDGNLPVKKFEFHIETDLIKSVSYIDAKSKGSSLGVKEIRKSELEDVQHWEIYLKYVLKSGQRTKVKVITAFTHLLVPYPTHIQQGESQLIKYFGNAYFYTPYLTKKQTTHIICYSDKLESFSIVEPVSVDNNIVTYGPYENVEPLSVQNLTVHYVNNEPFIVITNLERTIEVSHWGNIAVEETVEIHHEGAILKGPFSRLMYEQLIRTSPQIDSSVSSYVTVLPASAKYIYYRDEIGNVSSSQVVILDDSVHLILRFRFPLLGGWKIRYTVGYNVPTYEYLYSNGADYSLRMKIVDHINDYMVVNEFVLKVILPEYCEDVWMYPPFPVVHLPETKHFTYLDVVGRPVITVAKNNLVDFHIQDFEIQYTFPKYMMIVEPLLSIAAVYFILVVIILVNRIDFAIENNKQLQSDSKRHKTSKLLFSKSHNVIKKHT